MKSQINLLRTLCGTILVAVAGWTAWGAPANAFNAADYAALRAQLRAFHPDECHDRCKDPAYAEAERAINADLDAYAAAHPGYDVFPTASR